MSIVIWQSQNQWDGRGRNPNDRSGNVRKCLESKHKWTANEDYWRTKSLTLEILMRFSDRAGNIEVCSKSLVCWNRKLQR